MKYLKTYKEAIEVLPLWYKNHEHKSVIEDMLLELKDSEFHTTVSIQKFHNNHETVRVHVEKDKEFNWNDISQVISDVASYMELEDYNIVDFTCKDDVEFKENPDDFEVKKIVQAHYWGTDSSGEIKSELKDVLQIPQITQTSVYDAVTFNKIDQWIFDIKFKKQLIEVDKTRGVSKITNEELSPSKYFRVADELKKMGHIRRP